MAKVKKALGIGVGSAVLGLGLESLLMPLTDDIALLFDALNI